MPFSKVGKACLVSTHTHYALTSGPDGQREMSATQVTAAMVLLRKTLPDLTATELRAEVVSFTAVLDRIAAAQQVGNSEVQDSEEQRSIH